MTKLIATLLVATLGCGTILIGGSVTIVPPPGGTVDGVAHPISASKKSSHQIVYPDGRVCIIESGVSAGYVVADIVFWFLLGIIIDGATGNWKTLDEGACPGVTISRLEGTDGWSG